ncbi:MAG: ribonuclease J [bacterium]|nr:ribonuclease J [bacterium]
MDKRHFKPQHQDKYGVLRLIPLGGVGDVTKNMYIYEYGNDIVIIDCGLGFPNEAMPGIDLVIPDISYLRDKKERIRGIVITHAHDDHIGGLPYLWPELQCPIYAQRLAAGFIRAKFSEHRLPKNQINTLSFDSKLQLGVFNLSFYRVSHSVPDSSGIVLETPVGRVIHQADFKLDWTPVNGQVTEVGKVAAAGDKGVLLMLIDALRIEKEGYNLSESTIQPTFQRIEENSPGRIFLTTTSSNITRIQQALNVAAASGRRVAFLGRSMEGNFQVARDLGYLEVPPGLVIASDEIKRFSDNKLMIIIAGSQGQPGSALSRAANNDSKYVSIKEGDSIVFSADPIPGSESAQYALIDKLTKMGGNVYYTAITDDLHVSGHATAEEQKIMINLARPKYVMPIGATYRQMKLFSSMAGQMGWGKDKVILAEDGLVVTARPGQVVIDGRVEAKNVYVDGLGVGDVGNIVLRDRRVLAEEGIVLVIVPMDTRTSQLGGELDIISRGFVFEKEAEGLLEGAKKIVRSALSDHPQGVLDWRFIRRHIEESLEQYFYEETQRRPMILPVVVEV